MQTTNSYTMESTTTQWSPKEALFLLRTKISDNSTFFTEAIDKESLTYARNPRAQCQKSKLPENFFTQLNSSGFINRGIDPAENAFSIAMNNARLSGIDIKYEKGNGDKLPYSSASFDAVFCTDVLEQVVDVNKFFSEVSRVLKPGGILFFDTASCVSLPKPLELRIWQGKKNSEIGIGNKHVWGIFIKPRLVKNKRNAVNKMSWTISVSDILSKNQVSDFVKRANLRLIQQILASVDINIKPVTIGLLSMQSWEGKTTIINLIEEELLNLHYSVEKQLSDVQFFSM